MILIRADANPSIGSGHIVRCLSVAKELKLQGQEIIFATADHYSEQLLMNNGFKTVCLDSSWKDMEIELPKLKALLKEYNIAGILIDSYYVTKQYLKELNELIKIILFDDLNQFIYPVPMIINYNINALNTAYKESEVSKSKLLLGCRYIPLREEFRGRKKMCSGSVKHIMVSTGGSDQFNIMGRLLERIQMKREFKDLTFHAVIGPLNHNFAALERQCSGSENIRLHQNVRSMAQLMTSCDLAISAGGSTLYELCACAVPSVSFSYADNQIPGAVEFDRRNLIEYAGDFRENASLCLEEVLSKQEKLCSDHKLRVGISDRMQELVDGYGSSRIAEEMLKILE